jgi:dihydrolipoamide dehydrogenase
MKNAEPMFLGIWAVGDLIPTLQLAHVGFAEGIMVAEEIAGLNPRSINYDGVPRVTYSEPEVASVGLTTAAAKAKGHDVVELNYDLAGNGKANILKTAGSVKLVAQKMVQYLEFIWLAHELASY